MTLDYNKSSIMIKKVQAVLVAAALTFGMVACQKPDNGFLWQDEWEKEDPTPDPKPNPDPDPDPDPTPDTGYKGKPRMVWIDAGANFEDYANDAAKITEDLKKIKETGFTHVIVDVRPTNTGVLYKSKVEHELDKVDAWTSSGYVWVRRTADFDYLRTFIDEGHKAGLNVFASMNTFVGGYKCYYGLGSDGILYRDSSKKKWASVINASTGLINTVDLDREGTQFLSPANDEVVEYLLSIIGEIATYNPDGIILDRCRFDDYSLKSDFSDAARTKFESYIGKSVANWPSDIFTPGQDELGYTVTTMQKDWLAFRAKLIHDFIEKAADKVHSISRDCKFGAYVGAWYSSYYQSGVNWASPKYDPKADGYRWANDDYKKYGYADHCDIMLIGAYAASDAIYGSGEWTMEGFCKQAKNLFKDDVPYIGGPDIGNSTGFEDGGQGDKMPDIVDVFTTNADGMFVFDLVHIKKFNYWSSFKNGIDKYLETVK